MHRFLPALIAIVVLPSCGGRAESGTDASADSTTGGGQDAGTETDSRAVGEDATTITSTQDVPTNASSSGFESTGEGANGDESSSGTGGDGLGAQCDPWRQDCPEGLKCVPDTSSPILTQTHCVPLHPEPDQVGDSCTFGDLPGEDSCDLHALCEGGEDGLAGTCAELCQGSADSPICSAGHTCIALGVVNLCEPLCDPLVQNCPDGEGCYFGVETFTCWSTVFGGYDFGDDCGGIINACHSGLACADASTLPACSSSYCCTEFCPAGEPFECSDSALGAECVPWFPKGDAPPGLENVGTCILP